MQALLEAWPAPAPLEGVKSRKRAIFRPAPEATLIAAGRAVQVSDSVSLSLESRIAATTEAGNALVSVLLEVPEAAQAATGGVEQMLRNDGLAVVRLGPHLVASNRTPERFAEAAISALEEARPQVVVLEEAADVGDQAWHKVYSEVLASEAVRSFRGAVVVRSIKATRAVRRLCNEKWEVVNDQIWQIETAGADVGDSDSDTIVPEDSLATIEGFEQGAPEVKVIEVALEGNDQCIEGLLANVSTLSYNVFNEEDSVAEARKKGWSVVLLVAPAGGDAGKQRLCGYLCYELLPPPRAELYIRRLAVPEENRGRGYGRLLMRWVIDMAAQMPTSKCKWLSCSALTEVVPFYEQLGFCDMTCGEVDTSEGSQTWMELKNISLVPDAEAEA